MKNSVVTRPFGSYADGREALSYTLQLTSGVSATITDLGASLIGFVTPSRAGELDDIALGCASAAEQMEQTAYLGSAVGRVAGRISSASFNLDGQSYQLSSNDRLHHLHGGGSGFSKKLWSADILDDLLPCVRFTLVSPDGEEGYPGRVKASLTYRLEPPAKLSLLFEAETDRPTPFNPTSHAYFNLEGHSSGNVHNHQLEIFAKRYTPITTALIPTGQIKPVAGTPYDFRKLKPIACDWEALAQGYDHNFIIDPAINDVCKAAIVFAPSTGRQLTVWTDRPCVHLYTGGALNVTRGKHGASYGPLAGLCLETQGFPDALNHQGFPSDILRPGERFRSQTIFDFN